MHPENCICRESLMNFHKMSTPVTQISVLETECFQHPRSPHCASSQSLFPYIYKDNLVQLRLVSPIFELYVQGSIQYVLLCLTSFTQHYFRGIHYTVVNNCRFFTLIAVSYYILRINYNLSNSIEIWVVLEFGTIKKKKKLFEHSILVCFLVQYVCTKTAAYIPRSGVARVHMFCFSSEH